MPATRPDPVGTEPARTPRATGSTEDAQPQPPERSAGSGHQEGQPEESEEGKASRPVGTARAPLAAQHRDPLPAGPRAQAGAREGRPEGMCLSTEATMPLLCTDATQEGGRGRPCSPSAQPGLGALLHQVLTVKVQVRLQSGLPGACPPAGTTSRPRCRATPPKGPRPSTAATSRPHPPCLGTQLSTGRQQGHNTPTSRDRACTPHRALRVPACGPARGPTALAGGRRGSAGVREPQEDRAPVPVQRGPDPQHPRKGCPGPGGGQAPSSGPQRGAERGEQSRVAQGGRTQVPGSGSSSRSPSAPSPIGTQVLHVYGAQCDGHTVVTPG